MLPRPSSRRRASYHPLVPEPIDVSSMSYEPLARNRDFKVLLTSQGVSALGDAVTFTALPLLVLALTGSGLMMGIVGALRPSPISCSGWWPVPSPIGPTVGG
jgi:hypothetical protein